jgi:hypothetical protein
MKQALLIAGAAALAFAAPAMAKPGKGHGKAHKHGYGHVQQGSYYGKGVGGCPPGHAKHPGVCMPHGQWKKQFRVGQRLPLGAFSPYAYNRIPYDLRSQYGLNQYGNYYYGDGYLYRVDPKTLLVQQVIAALLR